MAGSSSSKPTIKDVPDSVLLSVLENLSQSERLGTAALVCRDWAKLARSPPLLHRLELHCADSAQLLERVRSFGIFAVRRAAPAGSMRQLHIDIDCQAADEEDHAEIIATLLAAVAACGSGLKDLLLQSIGPLHAGLPTSVLAALPRLQRLKLSAWDKISIKTPLPLLSSLQELELSTGNERGVSFGTSAVLPTSLTKLKLCGPGGVPPQLTSLPQLRQLCLRRFSAELNGLSQLAGSLEYLHMEEYRGSLGLAELTGLTHLRTLRLYCISRPGGAMAVEEALAPLGPHLTELWLAGWFGEWSTPALLAPLSRLQHLVLPDQDEDNGPMPAAGSGWWGQLRQLVLPADLATTTTDAFTASGAMHLQLLALEHLDFSVEEHWQLVVQAVQRLPCLRHVHLSGFSTPKALRELEGIARRHGCASNAVSLLAVSVTPGGRRYLTTNNSSALLCGP